MVKVRGQRNRRLQATDLLRSAVNILLRADCPAKLDGGQGPGGLTETDRTMTAASPYLGFIIIHFSSRAPFIHMRLKVLNKL